AALFARASNVEYFGNLSYFLKFSFSRLIEISRNNSLLSCQNFKKSLIIPAEELIICPIIKPKTLKLKYPLPIWTDEPANDWVILVLAIVENCFCRVVQYCNVLYKPVKNTPNGINQAKAFN